MLTPRKLIIRNFQSFGNSPTTVNLDFEGSMLVQGQNYDSIVDGQLDSNGSGKSTIMHALCYAGYDRIISEETGAKTKDSLINNRNEKNMEVTFDLEKDDNVFYRIERFRKNKAKGGDGVKLFRRDGDMEFVAADEITPASLSDTNDMIAKIIGMPFEIFSRLIVFAATHDPFLSLPATHATKANQTDVIEELCGITELSEKAEKLKKLVTANKQELGRLHDVNDVLVGERERNASQIVSAKAKVAAWEEGHAAQLQANVEASEQVDTTIDYDEQVELFEFIQTTNAQIATINADILNLKNEKAAILRDSQRGDEWDEAHAIRIEKAVAGVEAYPSLDFDTLSKNLTRKIVGTANLAVIEQDIRAINTEVKTKTVALEKEQADLAHLFDSKCPYCSQNYAAAKAKIVETDNRVEALKSAIADLDVKRDALELSIPELTSEIAAMGLDAPFATEAALSAYRSKHDSAKAALDLVNDAINPFSNTDPVAMAEELKAIDSDTTKLNSNLTKRTKKKLEAEGKLKFDTMTALFKWKSGLDALTTENVRLKAAVNPHTDSLTELQAVVLEDSKNDEIAAVEDLLEHQSFLVKLLTKKDSFMRKFLLQKTLPFLNTRLKHYLDMLGLPHKVTFREDLMVNITQFDKVYPFYRLSNGQKARINLALSFAFRDVLQKRHGRVNLCILDECLDVGLGNVGITMAAKMIKQVATTEKLSMFVISHRDEVASMFDKRLVVELHNGLSTLRYVD